MYKKTVLGFLAVVGAWVIASFFIPLVPVLWTITGIVTLSPYRATWTQVYYAPVKMMLPEGGEVSLPPVPITGATLRNTYWLYIALNTPDGAYGLHGEKLTTNMVLHFEEGWRGTETPTHQQDASTTGDMMTVTIMTGSIVASGDMM